MGARRYNKVYRTKARARARAKCKKKKLYLSFDEASRHRWGGMVVYECPFPRKGIGKHFHIGHIALNPKRHR